MPREVNSKQDPLKAYDVYLWRRNPVTTALLAYAPVQEEVLGHVCCHGDMYWTLLALRRPHSHDHLLLVAHFVCLHSIMGALAA